MVGIKAQQVPLPLPSRRHERDEDFVRHIQYIHADIRHRIATSNAQYKMHADAH